MNYTKGGDDMKNIDILRYALIGVEQEIADRVRMKSSRQVIDALVVHQEQIKQKITDLRDHPEKIVSIFE